MRRRLLLSLAFVLALVLGVALMRSERLRELPSPRVTLWPPRIELGPPVRVSLIKEARKMPAQVLAVLEPQTRAWYLAQQTGICELHQAKMQRRVVPDSTLLPASTRVPSFEEEAMFPYGADSAVGGCPNAAEEYEVYRCPQCEQLFRAWGEKVKQEQKALREPATVPLRTGDWREARRS